MNCFRFLAPLLSLGVTLMLAGDDPTCAADTDAVKEKLEHSKTAYDIEFQRFKNAVMELLDKREEEARKNGNKKVLDQVKADRTAFEKKSALPTGVPPAIIKPIAPASDILDKAYSAAVRDFIKLKDDAAADKAEKEQRQHFLDSCLLYGKQKSLGTLKVFDVKVWKSYFNTDKTYKVDGVAAPKSIAMHADVNGQAQASFSLGGKAIAFRSGVGFPKDVDPQANPASPVTFEVLGDGKSLWKSEPVIAIDTIQTCMIKVTGVKTLTLRVSCKDFNWVHAGWITPIVIE